VFREERLLPIGTGVIDRYIEPAKPFNGAINQTAHVFLSPNIRPYKLSLNVARAKCSDQSQAHVVVATRNDEPGALLCKRHRGGAANSSQRTGYKNNCRTHMTSGNISTQRLQSPDARNSASRISRDYGPLTQANTTFSETGVIASCPWLLSLCNCATLPFL
jgi:hypothetical protein